MPLVSVIIPTHSRPHMLPRAVASAFEAGSDVEVIVVDDASTDATAEVCRSLSKIRYVRLDRNRGTAGARNVAIEASSAEFVSFLDDDDVRLPGSIDRQISLLARDGRLGFVYGPVFSSNQQGRRGTSTSPVFLPTGDLFWELLSRCFVPCISVVFRKSAARRVGLLDAGLRGFDEWDLWVRIAEHFEAGAVDEPVGIWREPTPSSGQGTSQMALLLTRILRHQDVLLRLPRAAADPARCRLADQRLRDWVSDNLIAYASAWLHEDGGAARANLLAALRLNPFRATRVSTIALFARSFLGTAHNHLTEKRH